MAASYTVLVVERAELLRRTIKRVLAQRGCRVLEAADATDAVAVLATSEMHIDLVLIGAVGSLERGQLRWEWPHLPQQPQPSAAGKSGRTREPDPIALPSSCTGPPAEAEAALRAERRYELKATISPAAYDGADSRH